MVQLDADKFHFLYRQEMLIFHLSAPQKQLDQKKNLVQKLAGKKNGKILDIGCGTGEFLGTMKNAGWETLGLDKANAERIFDEEKKEGFMSAREIMYGGQSTRYDKKGRAIDKEGNLMNPDEAEDDDDEEDDGPEAGSVSNAFECSQCGYTLFVAKGRESKFFGEGFKCPECGAPKDKFEARDDFGE